ncbi:MAG: hypothetical protein ACTJLL_02070, partial [Anaplasma sp.]
GYVATQRQLLRKFSIENGVSDSDIFSRDSIEKFLLHPKGAKFAYDIMEYEDAFRAVSSGEHTVYISGRDAAFIREAQEIVTKITQQNPEIKAVIAESKGTSTETLRMLYGFTSPYVQFLNHDLRDYHNVAGSEKTCMEITAHFLVDENFRKVLVSQAIKWALAAVDKYTPAFNSDSTKFLLFKVEAQNCASNYNSLPLACTAVSGLMESVLFLVQALKRRGSDIKKLIPPHYLRQMLQFEGLSFNMFPREIALRVMGQHEAAAAVSTEYNIPSCVRALAMVKATCSYERLRHMHCSSEGCTPPTLLSAQCMEAAKKMEGALLKQHIESQMERGGAHLGLSECIQQVNEELLRSLEHQKPPLDINALTMYSVINTIKELTHNEKCSVAALEGIAELTYEHVGELLVGQGDEIHKRLAGSLLCNDINEQRPISACVVDVDVSEELQHATEIFKLGGKDEIVARFEDEAAHSDDGQQNPSSTIGDVGQIIHQAGASQHGVRATH